MLQRNETEQGYWTAKVATKRRPKKTRQNDTNIYCAYKQEVDIFY